MVFIFIMQFYYCCSYPWIICAPRQCILAVLPKGAHYHYHYYYAFDYHC